MLQFVTEMFSWVKVYILTEAFLRITHRTTHNGFQYNCEYWHRYFFLYVPWGRAKLKQKQRDSSAFTDSSSSSLLGFQLYSRMNFILFCSKAKTFCANLATNMSTRPFALWRMTRVNVGCFKQQRLAWDNLCDSCIHRSGGLFYIC